MKTKDKKTRGGKTAAKGAKAAKAMKTAKKPAPKKTRLPGEYPPQEDIMESSNGMERVHVDMDNLDLSKKTGKEITEELAGSKKKRSQSDLTKDDLQALGDPNLSGDEGDDDLLKNRTYPVDFSGKDLDVPGSENDDASEAVGSEDEENNSYSIGGDRHEDLEEDRA